MPVNLIRRLVDSELAVSVCKTFIARAVAALGGVLLMIMLGRLYGPGGVGVYAISYSCFLGVAIIAKAGLDGALMKYVGQSNSAANAIKYLSWAAGDATRYVLIGVCFLLIFGGIIERGFNSPGVKVMLLGGAAALPAFVFSYLLSGFFKGVHKPATACLLENGAISLVLGIFVFVLARGGGIGWGGFATLSAALVLSTYLVLIFGLTKYFLWREKWRINSELSSLSVNVRPAFRSNAFSFLISNFSLFSQSVLSILIAGLLLNSSDVGLLRAVQQVGVLIAFVLLVLNAVFPPRFARLHNDGRLRELERSAKLSVKIGGAIVLPIVFFCMVTPEWILAWMGEEFRDGATLLRVIAVGQLVNVLVGSVGFLLIMSGHEKTNRNIVVMCNLSGLVLLYFFSKSYGVVGAAASISAVLVIQNLIALAFVWRKVGIWPLPGPNFLKCFGMKTRVPGFG